MLYYLLFLIWSFKADFCFEHRKGREQQMLGFCRHGGIGRRAGLKIPFDLNRVSVRPRLPACEKRSRKRTLFSYDTAGVMNHSALRCARAGREKKAKGRKGGCRLCLYLRYCPSALQYFCLYLPL